MKVEQITTSNGIDDIKLIGETDLENDFIKQLAEAGTLSCLNRAVSNTALFRPISVIEDVSSFTSTKSSIGKYNFSVIQNQESLVDLTFKSDSAALDLSQFLAIKLQVKYTKSAQAIIDLSIGNGLTISGDDLNVLEVAFTADQTKALSCRDYYYDVMMETATSKTYYLEGKITVKTTATR